MDWGRFKGVDEGVYVYPVVDFISPHKYDISRYTCLLSRGMWSLKWSSVLQRF